MKRKLAKKPRPMTVHGWRLSSAHLYREVHDEKTLQRYLCSVSYTACGRKIYGKWPTAVARGKKVTCKTCKQKGCR